MELRTASREEIKNIKKLYREAFPAQEQKPFFLLKALHRKGKAEILYLWDGDFRGLAITLLFKDLVLLDYFAVSEGERGKGYGSAAIAAILERYRGKRVLIEIESPDDHAENNAQRLQRRRFYLRNGFTDLALPVCVYGTDFELLANQCSVTYDEYVSIYRFTIGKYFTRKINISPRNVQTDKRI